MKGRPPNLARSAGLVLCSRLFLSDKGQSVLHCWGSNQRVWNHSGAVVMNLRTIAKRLDPATPWRNAGLIEAYALAGRRKEGTEWLAQLLDLEKREFVSSFAIGQIHAALGETSSSLFHIKVSMHSSGFQKTC